MPKPKPKPKLSGEGGTLGALIELGQYEMAVKLKAHEEHQAELKRLGGLMAKAASEQDFEAAIKFGDDLKALKAQDPATAGEAEAWAKVAQSQTFDDRYVLWQTAPDELRSSEPELSGKFDNSYGSIETIQQRAKTDLAGAARQYAEGARCLHLVMATRTQPHVLETWKKLLEVVAAELGGGVEALETAAEVVTSRPVPAKLLAYIDGLQRMQLVARLIGAAAQEAFLAEELRGALAAVEERWAALQGLAANLGVASIGATPTLDEIRAGNLNPNPNPIPNPNPNPNPNAVCMLTLQPLDLGVAAAVTVGGNGYFAPAANLWRHRVSAELPPAVH